MRILVTNDDGIYAPGLAALAEAVSVFGEIQIVAPLAEQSGVSHSITYLTPLLARVIERDGRIYGHAVAGSPADCVKLAVLELCRMGKIRVHQHQVFGDFRLFAAHPAAEADVVPA